MPFSLFFLLLQRLSSVFPFFFFFFPFLLLTARVDALVGVGAGRFIVPALLLQE